MLKRQRVSTPPPSASTPDEEAYPPPPMDEPRQSNKRQRILPPSLDGQARGWMNHPPGQSPTDSDEEYIDEDEIHDYSMLRLGDGGVDFGPPTAAYKEVNHFLHDLHAEQQHRTLFTLGSVSSEMPSNLASPAFFRDLPLEMNHHHKYALHHPLPPLLSTIQRKDGSGDGQSIGQEYEHSNRLLRDLFLARRRHLSDAPPG